MFTGEAHPSPTTRFLYHAKQRKAQNRVIRRCVHIWNAPKRSQICLKSFCTSTWIWLAPRLGENYSRLHELILSNAETTGDKTPECGEEMLAPLTGVHGNSNCMFHPATRPCKPTSGRKNFKVVMRDRRRAFHSPINWMSNTKVVFLAHSAWFLPGLWCLSQKKKKHSPNNAPRHGDRLRKGKHVGQIQPDVVAKGFGGRRYSTNSEFTRSIISSAPATCLPLVSSTQLVQSSVQGEENQFPSIDTCMRAYETLQELVHLTFPLGISRSVVPKFANFDVRPLSGEEPKRETREIGRDLLNNFSTAERETGKRCVGCTDNSRLKTFPQPQTNSHPRAGAVSVAAEQSPMVWYDDDGDCPQQFQKFSKGDS
ncbi:hypothetical protein BKA64DRAFT_646858 [Cadophora sp. MPI-SDFR-AT-0126]|nr:hypothetical protein BKA64DRAFT_646858 [Leotiomycetes sp. MPI-SDFR-AT-0126]